MRRYHLDWLSANYLKLSVNDDEEGDVSEVTRRRSAMVPDSVQPHIAPRATGAARDFNVPQQPNGQNTFTTSSSTYPTGNNGQFLANSIKTQASTTWRMPPTARTPA